MADLDRLEEKIDRNATAIASLVTVTKTMADREKQREQYVCNVHKGDLNVLNGRIAVTEDGIMRLKFAIANRWPNLIAAAVGGMLPVLGLVLALWIKGVK